VSIYAEQTFSTEFFHNVSFSCPFEQSQPLSVAIPDDEVPELSPPFFGTFSPSSSVLAACGSADLEEPSLSFVASVSPVATPRCFSSDPTQLLSEVKEPTSGEPSRLSPTAPARIPASSTGGVVAIRADGDCCFHLAGEIEALYRNENALGSGVSRCLAENTGLARKKILENFEWLQFHLNGFCCSSEELEHKTVDHRGICERLPHTCIGRCKRPGPVGRSD